LRTRAPAREKSNEDDGDGTDRGSLALGASVFKFTLSNELGARSERVRRAWREVCGKSEGDFSLVPYCEGKKTRQMYGLARNKAAPARSFVAAPAILPSANSG